MKTTFFTILMTSTLIIPATSWAESDFSTGYGAQSRERAAIKEAKKSAKAKAESRCGESGMDYEVIELNARCNHFNENYYCTASLEYECI